MKLEEPEAPASERRIEKPQERAAVPERPVTNILQEPEEATSSATIVIFCHPRNVQNLVQLFEMQIRHAAGELPMFVLWSGVSGVLHQGVIVLEWEGKVSPAFLKNVSIDHEIFDYVVYDWTLSNESQKSSSEQTEATLEDVNKAAGRPRI